MKVLALIAFVISLCGLTPTVQAREIGLSVQIVQPGVSGVIHVGRPLPVVTPVWVEPAWVPEPWCDEPHRHHVYRAYPRDHYRLHHRAHHRAHHRDHHRAYHPHHHRHEHRHHGQHPRHRYGRD